MSAEHSAMHNLFLHLCCDPSTLVSEPDQSIVDDNGVASSTKVLEAVHAFESIEAMKQFLSSQIRHEWAERCVTNRWMVKTPEVRYYF